MTKGLLLLNSAMLLGKQRLLRNCILAHVQLCTKSRIDDGQMTNRQTDGGREGRRARERIFALAVQNPI